MSQEALTEICALLEDLWVRSGLTDKALARRCGYSLSHVNAIRNGKINVPPSDREKIKKWIAACTKTEGEAAARWQDFSELAAEYRNQQRRAREQTTSTPQDEPHQTRAAGGRAASVYLEQVRRIAPPLLKGREAELAELATFCTAPGEGGYLWWRAPAWSGKSALLSWFVLNPPAGVTAVSFFITGRFASHNNRVAFTDALIEQLAALVGPSTPPYLSEATRDAYFLSLLREAAEHCQRQAKRLVLVVDGLDEDRGVTGPGGHSIAGLLPDPPPAGVRVVVTGRPHPPIPWDVPSHHRLRTDPAVERPLAVSPYATAAREVMEAELDRLLSGPEIEQDLLGLLVAASGGLSGVDLAELTGQSEYQIIRLLGTVAGRSFTPWPSWHPGSAPDLYVLGHGELQKTATMMLGEPRLTSYRERLHRWADRYRDEHWPDGTPEYLLGGYYEMLLGAGDVGRMVICTTDQHRHDRILAVTGGDTVALAEIRATLEAVANQSSPDLAAAGRLAVHRDRLTRRNSSIPSNLPAVWARLGHYKRAENLAQSIDVPSWRAEALVSVARAWVAAGGYDRAETLINQAETLARSINGSFQQADALVAVVEGLVAVGKYDRAETLAHSIDDRSWQAEALVVVFEGLVGAGEHKRAETLIDEAETLVHSEKDRLGRAEALVAVVEGLLVVGEYERAETIIHFSLSRQPGVLAGVARAWVAAGEYDRADTVARSIDVPYWRVSALVAVAQGLVAASACARAEILIDQAETLARSIDDSFQQAEALAAVARAWVAAGEHDRAETLAEQAETLARSIVNPSWWVSALVAVAQGLVAARKYDRAETVIHSLQSLFPSAEALVAVAQAWVAAGKHDRADTLIDQAETLARSIDDSFQQAEALAAVARAWVAAGEYDRAESVARSINDPFRQASSLVAVAQGLVAAGEYDRAESVARSINDPFRQAEALVAVARELVTAGEYDRAETLTDQAETLARSINGSFQQASSLVAVAQGLVAAGKYDRAESVARSINDPFRQAEALVAVARELVTAGEYDRAETLTDQAETLAHSTVRTVQCAEALVAVVEGLVAAGKYYRAETVARSINARSWQMSALVTVAQGLIAAGKYDRAETLARSLQSLSEGAEVLVARAWVAAGEHASSDGWEFAYGRAARSIARVFQTGDWTRPWDLLTKVDPGALCEIAEEYLELAGL